MNHVTFETAKKLKKAGFPQLGPFDSTEIWYYETATEIIPMSPRKARESTGFAFKRAYAPTATELLPERWFLSRSEDEWKCVENPCSYYGKRFYSDNPAEAAAQAWLHVNATKTETI